MMKRKYKKVRVYAPATVANVSCGFDVMGLALHAPGDEIVARYGRGEGITITSITGDGGVLPHNVAKNTASVAVRAMLDDLNITLPIELEVHKKMPLGSGLGSSAASSAGALLAVNYLLDQPFSRKELLPFAAEGERAACGTAHYDNVAPSMLGGFAFIRSSRPPDILELPFPEQLHVAVLHPHIEIKTKNTRKVLRREINLSQAVTQWGNVGGLVAGLMNKDMDLISRSMQDVIIEPMRSPLIPGFDDVKEAALSYGAVGAGIAGSGPSIFALTDGRSEAKKVMNGMKKTLDEVGLSSDQHISPVNP